MIFDRIMTDVRNAKKIREEKVQNFLPLDESDINTLERGSITVNTLNRIESKQSELKTLLNKMGYWNTNIKNRSWMYSEIFDKNNFDRIVENNIILREAFYVYTNSPQNAVAKYHYNEINALERILFDLETMIEYVRDNYRECDTFYSGED